MRAVHRETVNPDMFPGIAVPEAHGGRRRVAETPAARMQREALRAELGWAPRRAASKVRDAGDGLHVDGHVQPGTVVALMPGQVYFPEHLRTEDDCLRLLFPDPEFHLCVERGRCCCCCCQYYARCPATATPAPPRHFYCYRYYRYSRYSRYYYHQQTNKQTHPAPLRYRRPDDIVIDARAAADQPEPPHGLAMAHLCNHPPPGAVPNVALVPYDVPLATVESNQLRWFKEADALPERLAELVPNAYHAPPTLMGGSTQIGVRMRSACLITLHSVEDEELYLDYRLNPAHAPPRWYTPVREGVDARVWSGPR